MRVHDYENQDYKANFEVPESPTSFVHYVNHGSPNEKNYKGKWRKCRQEFFSYSWCHSVTPFLYFFCHSSSLH
jgi:hypothetical protein